MSNILIVSPTPFAPANAGNRERVKALIEALMEDGHCVHFAHVTREDGDALAMQAVLHERFHSITYSPKKGRNPRYRKLQAYLKLDSAFRYEIDEWYDYGIEQPILDIVHQNTIETVIVEYIFLSRLLTVLPDGVKKVLDTHDIFGDRHQQFKKHGLIPAWFSCSVADEAKALCRADTVIAIQDHEARYFRSVASRPVTTIGHVSDVSCQYQRSANPTNLVYIGSNNPINLASLRWFLKNVMSDVYKRLGQPLRVVGSICDKLPEVECIERVGRVTELASVYRTAAVAINPSLFGTGLKIKTIEALAHGCPVVATSNGAQGFEQARDKGLLVTDDPQGFQDRLIQLLTDSDWNQRMSLAARVTTEDYNRQCRHNLRALFNQDRAT